MQPSQVVSRSFRWKPWTMILNYRGLLVAALSGTPSKKATLKELCEVLGRHPSTAGEPRWKEKLRKVLEANSEFVVDQDGRWGFKDERKARETWRVIVKNGPSAWRNVPETLRRMYEAVWDRICTE